MKVYVARQPIFDRHQRVYGYELLYRDSTENAFSGQVDGDLATRAVISDTLTAFDFSSLAGNKRAFVNFTRSLLLENLAFLLDPHHFVIEILEDVTADGAVIERLDELKQVGFLLAADDYAGDAAIQSLIDYVDIVKVDFSLLEPQGRARLAGRLLAQGKRLLAEKVETEEDFNGAVRDGYTLFQGYYFARPTVFSKNTVQVLSTSLVRVMQEFGREYPSISKIARLIRQDIGLTYQLLRRVNTLEFYRGRQVHSVEQALLLLGLRELRRWGTLLFIRGTAVQGSDELARTALVRASFAERLCVALGFGAKAEDAFTVGMFSMIDVYMEESLPIVLNAICLSKEIEDALLGEENSLGRILRFVKAYEVGEWSEAVRMLGETRLDVEQIANYYLEAVRYADAAFEE